MRIDLQVPFADKDIAKRRGARWDPGHKTWYIQNTSRIEVFMEWIPEHLKQPTNSKPLEHGEFVVTAPRTPKKVNRRAKFR